MLQIENNKVHEFFHLHITTCSRKGLGGNVKRASQTTFYHRPEEKAVGGPMIKRREHRSVIRKRDYVEILRGLKK
jgi:hypothetical protein